MQMQAGVHGAKSGWRVTSREKRSFPHYALILHLSVLLAQLVGGRCQRPQTCYGLQTQGSLSITHVNSLRSTRAAPRVPTYAKRERERSATKKD
ncbi:hypothetical protein QQP08_010145 [Theobroma cacao]|nr:hypothetical protein QQP08_010145 [Theobroma cacao]